MRRRRLLPTPEVLGLARAWRLYLVRLVAELQPDRPMTRGEMEEVFRGYEKTLRAIGVSRDEAERQAIHLEEVYQRTRFQHYGPRSGPKAVFPHEATTPEGKRLEGLLETVKDGWVEGTGSWRVCQLCEKRLFIANRNTRTCAVCRDRWTKQQRWWLFKKRSPASKAGKKRAREGAEG